jgi:hypothetical protein
LFLLAGVWNLGMFGHVRDMLHLDQETISTFGNGLDEARLFRVIPQGVSHLSDSDAQAVVELNESILWPEPQPHFFAGDNLARPFYQHQQKTEG